MSTDLPLRSRRILTFVDDVYEDLELWYPYYRLQEAGATVRDIGTGSASVYASKHGYPVTVDARADDVSAAEFDAVIIPGGFAPDRLRRYPAVLKLVREAVEQGKVVAAIEDLGLDGKILVCSFDGDPETLQDPKRWLTRHMPGSCAYKETFDQAPLTAAMDLDLARANSRSFRHFESAVCFLMEAVRAGRTGVSPSVEALRERLGR